MHLFVSGKGNAQDTANSLFKLFLIFVIVGVTKSYLGGPFRSKEMMDLILVLGLSLKCDKFVTDFLEIKGSVEGMNTYMYNMWCNFEFWYRNT